MEAEKRNLRPVITVAIAAGVFMLVSGMGFRALNEKLSSPVNSFVMSQEDLDKLPLPIGDWSGSDVPLDEAIVKATDTDAHLNRQYSRQNPPGTVVLYIAYGGRGRDLMPHRPEVCYPGAGWTPGDVHAVELQLSDDMKLPSRILQFSRGTENVMVLDYYIVDGQYSSDVERLRKKAWLGSGTIKYVAQVEVIASVPSKQVEDLQKANVTEFASESASLILELFEKAANDESLSGNEIGKDPNEQ